MEQRTDLSEDFNKKRMMLSDETLLGLRITSKDNITLLYS